MGRDRDPLERPATEGVHRELPAPSRQSEILSQDRQPMVGRGYAYCLRPSELKTMKEIGRFRTIDERDLQQFRYGGDNDRMREDVQSLRDQGLLQRRTIWTGKTADRLTVWVLTKRGKAFLEGQGMAANQKIFAGFVKPAEVHHDAAIFRMYQVEAAKIEGAGGRIKRVVLDYELKQKVYPPLAKARATSNPTSPEYLRRQAQVAAQNELKVIHGKILLPDLRIEYEKATGEGAHVDLELATHHYRGSSLRAKAEAGFKLYAPQASAGRLAAFDPDLMGEIFSF